MLQIRTNVNSRTHYDEFGSQFVAGMPKMFFRSKDTIAWQLYSETPGLDENETPEENWTKFTGFSGMTGINAYLTADNNYTHRMKGKLLNSVSGTVSVIMAEISGAGFNTVPDTGTVNLFDNEGYYETVQYASRTIDGTTVVFTADGSPTLEKSYSPNAVMDAGEEVYMQATLDYQQSEVSTGLFVFNITAYSEKLRQAIVYSDVEAVPIRGLELAIFQVKDGYKQDVERYVVTTFKIMSGIAETGLDPVLPEEHVNEAALMVETLLASGLAVQYSEDGETWVDADESSSESTQISYSYFRFRLAGVGGEWSAPIYLRQGERGNRITNGTAITGTDSTPTPYLTGLDDSLVGDMYINTETQNVYVCVLEGNEETALWSYSYCLKGEAFDKLDYETIDQNSESELQAVGLKETNNNNTTKVWIGTRQQYDEQHKDDDNDVCYITDEEEALYMDTELSDSSVNPVQNRVITNALKLKQDIAEEVITSTATLLTVEPGKAYRWNLSSNGAIAFNHSNYVSKRVTIPVKLTLLNGATVTGATSATTAVTVEGTVVSGDWEMIWDGTLATFHRVGVVDESDSLVIDTQISNSSVNPVQNKAIAAALALKVDKSQIDTQLSNSSTNPVQNKVVAQALALKADKSQIDTQLSNSSTNPVQNKAISLALNNKLDILLPVTTSTPTSLAVEAGKAYAWTPSGNATISFNHTGLSGKHVSIPVYLTLSSGRTVSGSTSSSTTVTISGTLETGECELYWNGSNAYFQKRKGENGASGASSYLYIAYATNSSGSGWTTTADASHPYIAFKVSSSVLTPSSSDFSGSTWMKYLGSDGTRGSRINYGTAVTGTSTTPASYATGISDSLVNDLYINTLTKNLYQCTTGGNASTAKWAFVFSLYTEESDSTVVVSSVKLDGKTLQVVSGEVDIPALPMAEDLSDSSVQDIVLYSGYEDSDSHVPGHVYQKNMIVDDRKLTIHWYGYSETLAKSPLGYGWSNALHRLSYDSTNTRWKFENDYDNGEYSSNCDPSVMPWDKKLTWYSKPNVFNDSVDTEIPVSFTFLSQSIEWEDRSRTKIALNGIEQASVSDVTNIAALSIAETMPAANKTAQPYVLFLGTTSGSYTHGHLYKKNSTVSDSTITFSYGGTTKTLIKRSSTEWSDSDQDYSLSYSTTCWAYNNGGMGTYYSPSCPSTTMPWELSGQAWIFYEDNDIIYPTIPDPTTYSWTDAGTMLTTS